MFPALIKTTSFSFCIWEIIHNLKTLKPKSMIFVWNTFSRYCSNFFAYFQQSCCTKNFRSFLPFVICRIGFLSSSSDSDELFNFPFLPSLSRRGSNVTDCKVFIKLLTVIPETPTAKINPAWLLHCQIPGWDAGKTFKITPLLLSNQCLHQAKKSLEVAEECAGVGSCPDILKSLLPSPQVCISEDGHPTMWRYGVHSCWRLTGVKRVVTHSRALRCRSMRMTCPRAMKNNKLESCSSCHWVASMLDMMLNGPGISTNHIAWFYWDCSGFSTENHTPWEPSQSWENQCSWSLYLELSYSFAFRTSCVTLARSYGLLRLVSSFIRWN